MSIIDRLVARIDPNTKAAPVKDLRETPPTVPYTDHWRESMNKLTPDGLRQLLEYAEKGDMRRQAQFFEDMIERDGIVSGAFMVRKQAVIKNEWLFEPHEGSGRKGKKQADFLTDVAKNLSADTLQYTYDTNILNFDSMLMDSLDSIPMGYSAPLLNWAQDGNEWRIIEAQHVSQRHFMFGNMAKMPWNPYEVRIRTFDMDNPGDERQNQIAFGIPLPPFRYMFSTFRGFSGYPARAGLLRTLAWPYLLKWFALEGMAIYIEAFGIPPMLAKYDPLSATLEDDKKALRKLLGRLGRNFRGLISKTTDIEPIDMKTGREGNLIHKDAVEMYDNMFAITILGQSGTMLSTPGKLGEEKEKGDVRDDIMQADAKDLMQCIQRRWVNPQLLFNDGEILCDFVIKSKKEEDMNTKSKRYVDICSFMPVPQPFLREEFGIPEPQEGEAVTTVPTKGTDAVAAPFRQLVAAAHGSRRADRQAKVLAASKKLTSIMDGASRQALPVYQALLDGIEDFSNEKKVSKQLEKNKAAFIEALGGILDPALNQALALANDVLGIKPKIVKARRGEVAEMFVGGGRNKLTVKDSTAQDFVKYQGFTVRQIEGEKITQDLMTYIKDNIEKALDDGLTPVEFRETVMEGVGIGDMGDIKPYHVDLVFQMNVATAHSVSKYYGFMANKKFLPCWEFMGTEDSSSCDDCPPLIGKVFANDDLEYWPELHFGCRCEGSPIDALEQEDENYTITNGSDIDNDIKPEFKGDPVSKYQQYVADSVKSLPGAKQAIDDYDE